MNMRTMITATAALLLTACVPQSTDANQVGIGFCKFLCGNERVEVVDPGRTVFLVPFRTDWYTLDISMQNFYMTRNPKSGDRPRRDDLLFKTKEGNNIGQDVVVTWKIDFRQAEKVIRTVGPDVRHIQEKLVRPIARSVVRDSFSKLNSDEYYEGQRRFEEAKDATRVLKAHFEPYGIIIDQVNPKAYRFEDKDYQAAINTAKEAGQELEKAQLERESQVEYWKKHLETQKGISNRVVAEAMGEAQSIKLKADAKFEERRTVAEAVLKEKSAEAEGIRQMNQAMRSQGGDIAVKMEYARHFKPKDIRILPCPTGNGLSVNRLDVNALISAEASQASQ